MTYSAFKKTIWTYYKKNKREFPWRVDTSPYSVVVSEVMLQQTQAPRVVAKYESFLKKFPNFNSLAEADTIELLKEWKGLGYNSRALRLRRLAQIVLNEHGGRLPQHPQALLELPGIGPNTVGSILAFAFNSPLPFIETNIRTVFIHFFFAQKKNVHDRDILPLVEKTLDTKQPRDWYYALMDYGVYLKKLHPNPGRSSIHYKKQSPFKGSNRELRSQILALLLEKPSTSEHVATILRRSPHLVKKNIENLVKEGFLAHDQGKFSIV